MNTLLKLKNTFLKYKYNKTFLYVKKYFLIILLLNIVINTVVAYTIIKYDTINRLHTISALEANKDYLDKDEYCRIIDCKYMSINKGFIIDVDTYEYIKYNFNVYIKDGKIYYGVIFKNDTYYIDITSFIYITILNVFIIMILLMLFLYKVIYYIMNEEEYLNKAISKTEEVNNRYSLLADLSSNLKHEVSTPLYALRSIIDDFNYENDIFKNIIINFNPSCDINNKDLILNNEIICNDKSNLNKHNMIYSKIVSFIKNTDENISIGKTSLEQLYDIINSYNNYNKAIIDKKLNIYDIVDTTLKILVKTNINYFKDVYIDTRLKKFELEDDNEMKGSFLVNVFVNHFKNSLEANANKLIVTFFKYVDGYLYIDIDDNGNGISEEDTKKIFNKDYSTKDAVSDGLRGNGLYVNKVLLNTLYNNDDWLVKSIPNLSTVFCLKIKAKRTAHEDTVDIDVDVDTTTV